jgi:hypothetical protein
LQEARTVYPSRLLPFVAAFARRFADPYTRYFTGSRGAEGPTRGKTEEEIKTEIESIFVSN